MSMHVAIEPPVLWPDADLQARRQRTRSIGKSIRRGARALGGSVRPICEMLGAWLVRRRLTRDLQILDDRMLADIGVTRSDIAALVRHDLRSRLHL
jgi:uncharacterized protein YjiS (DUF1127 family)